MGDYEKADARLMDWLAERTDTQLQRLLDAPEDGLTNMSWRSCLAGRAFGWAGMYASEVDDFVMGEMNDTAREAVEILCQYGLKPGGKEAGHWALDDGRVMRRIQGFAAAELLTRRVERPKLPAPVEVMSADPLNSGYREGA